MQWFIKEQVEEVATMSALVAVVRRSKDNIEAIEEYIQREQRRTQPTRWPRPLREAEPKLASVKTEASGRLLRLVGSHIGELVLGRLLTFVNPFDVLASVFSSTKSPAFSMPASTCCLPAGRVLCSVEDSIADHLSRETRYVRGHDVAQMSGPRLSTNLCSTPLRTIYTPAERRLSHTVEVTVVLVGPTASGKSSLAAALVRRYAAEGRRAELVNADSMLVYRGMDIGTPKPSEAERAEIRHHMIDLLDVTENATVAEFQQLAREAIRLPSRGVIPIVVGGSALYVRAIIDDFDFPGTDPAVRARLEHELDQGAERLHQRLSDADPVAAARILPGNARRVIRALEVIELTGRSFSAVLPEHRYRLADVVQIGIAVDRPTLDARIAARWTQCGLQASSRKYAGSPQPASGRASPPRALGYRQVLRVLDGRSVKQRLEI